MEYVVGVIAVILLLWACAGNSGKGKPRYEIGETADERYCEVIDNDTGRVEFVGTKEQCENWIESHR